MNRFFSIFFISCLLFSSCGKYDDTEVNKRISDLENRMAALETLCNSMNSNVSSLQTVVTALQENDGISGFRELEDKSGYVISFTSGKTITILNGTDGTDGSTPAVSLKKDTDGEYYWTLNGSWLLVDGNKVKASGTDGITPRFKIDDYAWYVSYDGGKTWAEVESNVKEGCYIFKSVTIENGFVKFLLSDGTTSFEVPVYGSFVSSIKSIVYVPSYSDGTVRVYKSWDKYYATMRFEIQPESVLDSLVKDAAVSLKMNAVYTLTKSSEDSTKLTVSDISANGRFLELKVSCDSLGQSFFDGKTGVSASLQISDGFSTVAGNYIPMVYSGEEVKSTAFDASGVVLSLAAISDTHINGASSVSGKFRNALSQLKSKALENDTDGIDGVLVAGDLIDNPNQNYLNEFKSIYEGAFNPSDVPMVYTIGNHDVPNYRWSPTVVDDARYIRTTLGDNYFKTDQDPVAGTTLECRHCIIGGYHILSITPDGTQPIVYDAAAVTWLDNQLKTITSAEPGKYVIVMTHPMVNNTVYGSLLGEAGGIWESMSGYWSTSALTSILDKYPQVVVIGGHLHFPLNDPRSIWQGKFTALGCGSVRYMAIENGGYENMAGATTMNDKDEFSQGNLLQFDENGNMRVYRMDFYHDDVIGDPLNVSYPAEDLSNLGKYSPSFRSLSNHAPTLSSLEVSTKDDVTSVTFAAGEDDEFVHDYTLTLSKNGTVQVTKKILSDFYKHPKASDMASSWTVSLGNIGKGSFNISLTAADSWGASDTIDKDFEINDDSNIWISDDSGSMSYVGGSGSSSSAWLSYSDGTLSWSANTTGAPRTATITLPNSVICSVTQISADDFKGDWTFTSKVFCKDGFSVAGSKVTLSGVSFGTPLKGETLKDGKGLEHTNNIGVRGLYHTGIVADAAVKVDYTSKAASFGLFMDARTAQADPSPSNSSYPYIAFLPEMCGVYTNADSWGAPWSFTAPDLGNPDYEWIWFTVSDDFKTLTYSAAKAQELSTGNPNGYGPYIIGISVGSFKTSDATLANSQAQTVTAYNNVIYQFNTDNGSVGLVFERK
ncbi:MAG: PL29 family lyase N-terminal domain-containing protein [Bacteroidales bacterium]|jgi:predicted phosphodiesterase|nr:PL29 family lyase N-terminal domain-containing protein [Bacteroidales bacterium]MCI1785655.1 PL29 family lyase N-terminal domain-containing protein [Bacteroidales bacterium]